jgi:hypothetical protein
LPDIDKNNVVHYLIQFEDVMNIIPKYNQNKDFLTIITAPYDQYCKLLVYSTKNLDKGKPIILYEQDEIKMEQEIK